MRDKAKLEKQFKRLKARFEKAKQEDSDGGTSTVKASAWFPEQFKALEDELARSQIDLGRAASILNAIEDALKRLRLA